MQNIYLADTPWHAPWMVRILPAVEHLARHQPYRTIFTRFLPPVRQEDAVGMWRSYYETWSMMTRDHIDPRLLDLAPSLAALVPPAKIFDKYVYSSFTNGQLHLYLQKTGIDTLVISGAETDICVLSTVFGAIDLGYRVILARDAICSSSDKTHDLLIDFYDSRLRLQLEVSDTETILSNWN